MGTTSTLLNLLLLGLALLSVQGRVISDADNSLQGAPPAEKAAGYLKIGAFNIQNLGRTKMGRPLVVETIVKILNKYDIIFVQEIVDSSQVTPYQLLDELNKVASGGFRMELSRRQGRSTRGEQYAYYYRSSKVSVTDTYHWPDDKDVHERPPFCVRFSAPDYQIKDFAFIGVHTKPRDAAAETDGLTDVYDGMKSRWNLDDMILGGDFNAACNYVTAADWPSIRLRTQERFKWIISDRVDTTMADSQCAYDRLVLAGDNMKAAYANGDIGWAYRFEVDMDIGRDLGKEVSDHVPVQCGIA